MKNSIASRILVGTEHASLEEAIAADIVSALPIFGTITDLVRLVDSGEKPRRVLQALDVAAAPLPFVDIFTPSNTLIYLDKMGVLPFSLAEFEVLISRFIPGGKK